MWLPKTARDEHAKDVAAMAEMLFTQERFNKELHAIDPDLELVKAKPNADVTVPGLRPGYWHLLRRSDFACNLIVLEDPVTGAPRDPGGWMFDLLAENDLWNDRTQKMHRDRQALINAAREREEERERQERIDMMDERVASRMRTSVLVPRSV